MDPVRNYLFITFLEKEGPFLKLWGQTDKSVTGYIEQVLNTFSSQFDGGLCIPAPGGLQIGILCCAKYNDNRYHRVKITSLDFLQNRYVEVIFVDHGYKDLVPVSNIRSLEGFDNAFIAIPPLAHSFILADVVCLGGEWNDIYFDAISKELLFKEVTFAVLARVTKHFLIKIFLGGNDLALLLISRGLMQHTSTTAQEAVLLSMLPRNMLQAPVPQVQHSIVAYKAFVLDAGSTYEVYVSYVTEGPCNFSVQLKQTEEILGKLMKEMNSMNLAPIEGIPLPGTVCLCRCQEDGHICRAVVTNEVDGQYKVFYVDFGNYETVPLEALYEVPFKFVMPKAMAIRYALAGVEKSALTLDMQCAFKKFVDNRLLQMKVLPSVVRTPLPRCELWDPETQQSALDVVTKAAGHYSDPITLNRGFSQTVKVSYVFSCNRFYVQLKSKLDDLARLMADIQIVCQRKEPLPSKVLKIGMPCYALFESDQQYYRAQILEFPPMGNVKVHYIDYGNDETVPELYLKPIDGNQLTSLRPQAIECCLNGYQNLPADMERDNLLEELILEQEFTMKVAEVQKKKVLCELIDAANYNVASILLEKVAAGRSQVSPMLVQAGNKIEHRKSIPAVQQLKRSMESRSGELDKINDNQSWRQNNTGFRPANKTENADPNENQWQSNPRSETRPYKKNFERNYNEPDDAGNNWRPKKDFQSDSNRNRGGGDATDKPWPYVNKNKDAAQTNENGFESNEPRKSFSPQKADKPNADWSSDNKQKVREWDVGKEHIDFNKRDDFRGRGNNNNNAEKDNRGTSNGWGGQQNQRNEWKSGGNNGGGDNNRRTGGGYEGRRDGRNSREGAGGDRRPRNFDRNYEKTNGDAGGDWNAGNYKKPPFKREKSEVSSSGSEKSGRRSAPTNKQSPKFPVDDWAASPAQPASKAVPDPAASTTEFSLQNLAGLQTNITISWFYNPTHFYCQTQDSQADFKQLMADIQQSYANYTPGGADNGAPVIGLFPEDSVLYRAKVLDQRKGRYKVRFVDFGNVSVIDKVWPIENRFVQLPAQAICCKLDGIEPLDGDWSAATNYGPYFDKETFTCHFGQLDADKYCVKISSDGQDIGERLVADGVAKVPATPKQIELPLLISQQLRVMLLSVTNLGDFTVCLQNGTSFCCGVFNFDICTESFEDNLKQKIDQLIIIYVDDLKDDRLMVTPYDADGTKIKVIDKDEEAYENVDILCPYLILYSTVAGAVTHFEDGTVYLQPGDCSDMVDYLLNSMFESYDTTVLENAIVPVEGFVYAVKSSDGNWYRGRVTSSDEANATVMFNDYGNSETVEVANLRDLAREYMEININCLAILVSDATEELIGSALNIRLQFTEAGLEGSIESAEAAPPTDETIEPDQATVVENVAEIAPVQTVVDTAQVQGNLVVMSHMDSPSDFYLQLADSVNVIDELQATLQEKAVDMADVDVPVVGALCAAPYSVDQQWYRAVILDADADITTVRFVDYGNTDVINNTSTKLKTLSSDLLALETHATRCTLKIKPLDVEWSAEACAKFEELCNVEALSAQFLSQDEKTNYVELFSQGVSVRETLINEKLAQLDDEIVAETAAETVCFVSHLNSPSEFWIQLENCVEELERIAEQLTTAAASFNELHNLSPGTLCAALYPDDEMWYRARILSNTVAGIEVVFVDYGNSCTTCSLRELPEELVMMAPLAQKCSLQKPEQLIAWGPEMAKRFQEISADGQTTFTVNKLSTGETALVQLLLNGEDVANMLLPQLLEPVTVTKCDDLSAITLSAVSGGGTEKTYRLETLPDIDWNEESLQKFQEIVAKTPVMQAEFVDVDAVRLYVDYNDVRLELNGTKCTTPVKRPAPVASPCENLETIVNADDVAKPLSNEEVISDDSGVVEQELIKPMLNDIVTHIEEHHRESEQKEETDNPEESKPSEQTKVQFDESFLANESTDDFQECFEDTVYQETDDLDGDKDSKAEKEITLIQKEKEIDKKSDKDERPESACSGKLSHDEKIVSAYFSRPQTPISSDDEKE